MAMFPFKTYWANFKLFWIRYFRLYSELCDDQKKVL